MMTTNLPPQGSKPLGPDDNIPEMEVEDCRRLFRHQFGIESRFVEGSGWHYKFIGGVSNEFAPHCPFITVPAHHRGTKFCGLVIKRLLEKFEIKEEEFRTAYNLLGQPPPPGIMPRKVIRPN